MQVQVEVHALGLQTVAEIVDHLVDLVFVHALWNFAFHVFDYSADQAVFHVNLCFFVSFLLQFFLNILFQVCQGVEFADVFYKLIVQSRQLLLLNSVYLYFKDNCLTFEVLCMVIFREGNVYFELVAFFVTNYLLFKARDELTGAEYQREVFTLAAFECNAVFETFKVDQSGVAVLCSSFNIGQTGVSLSHSVQLCVDVSSHDGLYDLFSFDAFVVFNGNFRFYGNGCFEAEAFAVLYLQVGYICTVNRLDFCFFNSCFVSCWVYHIDGIVIEELFAIHFFDHCFWSLAFAEARQSDGFYLLFIRLYQSVLELLLAYLDLQLHSVVFKFVYRSQTHFTLHSFLFLCRIR